MLGPTPLGTGAFVAVDIEATGCRPGTSSIIEIGAARIESGAVVATFTTLVHATDLIPPAVTHLTGITQDMLADRPEIGSVMDEFRQFASDAVLVAHNHRFDMSFLDYEAERVWGTPFARPVLDTLTLARRLHPELPRHNLRDLALFYATETSPSHRALPDALATAEVFVRMLPELEAAGVGTAADVARVCGIAQQSRLARKLSLATHVPDEPGVYLFRNEAREVIFVGKAKALRSRIRNHFYAPDDITTPTPASEVAEIGHIVLVSPLDAALLEVRLQDRYRPVFNRDGHQRRRPLYLHVDTASVYPSLTPTHRRLRGGELLGPLSNEWATETVADAICEYFGLRRCRRTLEQCTGADCKRRDEHLCEGPDVTPDGQEAYTAGVRAALSVFDGRGTEFRELLRMLQEQCAAAERYEDAARYRDAIRALDRTLSALAVARRASSEDVVAILEGDEHEAVVLITVKGWHFTTLRLSRKDIERGAHLPRLTVALGRAVSRSRSGACVTPRQLRDMAIIDAYRQQHDPQTLSCGDDPARGVENVSAALRRLMRIPRKRHGAVSVG